MMYTNCIFHEKFSLNVKLTQPSAECYVLTFTFDVSTTTVKAQFS